MCKVVQTFHYNGNIKEKYLIINGLQEGEYKEYHKNGQLKEICNYQNGKRYNKN